MLLTDETFCGGGGAGGGGKGGGGDGEVRVLMERRRRHEECGGDGEGGCEVFVGRRCEVVGGVEGRGRGGRGWGLRGGMTKGIGRARFHQGTMMAGVDPKLVLLAVLIAVFSFLVNILVGMRLYDSVKSGWA